MVQWRHVIVCAKRAKMGLPRKRLDNFSWRFLWLSMDLNLLNKLVPFVLFFALRRRHRHRRRHLVVVVMRHEATDAPSSSPIHSLPIDKNLFDTNDL